MIEMIGTRIGAHQRAVPTHQTPFSAIPRHRQPRSRALQRLRPVQATGSEDGTAAPTDTLPYKGDTLPTLMNNIPHSRELRRHFYAETSAGVAAALADGHKRISVRCTIPELNTEFDVYRVGTLLEMVREIVGAMAVDGRRVKVCVQQSLGQGVFQGMPLSLSGVMRIMKAMDWGSASEFITLGNLGASEVTDDKADAYVLIAPQNVTGHSVVPLLEEMVAAADEAGGQPIVMINAKLGDVPSSGGVMGVRGRQERQDFVATFHPAYHFRLLYLGAGPYPIMGALRHTHGGPWEVLRRVDLVDEFGARKGEEYRIIGTFDAQPDAGKITACFQRR